MNDKEIQYLLDRNGYVELSPGIHLIDKPIQLGHLTGDIIIKGSGLRTEIKPSSRWPQGRFMFEFNKTGNQESPTLFFRDFSTDAAASYNIGFFKSIAPRTSPKGFSVFNCSIHSKKAYAIDIKNGCGIDFISLIFLKINAGGGAIRWRIGPNDKVGYFIFKNARHQTGDKIGPGFDYKNLRDTIHEVIIDEQNANIYSELKNRYAGPVSTRDINPRGYHLYNMWWNEYWTGTGDFPGCWIGEVRTDEQASTGQYFVDTINGCWGHSNPVGFSTLVAGNNGTGPPIVFNSSYDFAPDESKIKFAGKSWTRYNRVFFKTSSSSDSLSGVMEDQQSGSYRSPIIYSSGDPAGGGTPGERPRVYKDNNTTSEDRFLFLERSGDRPERDYEDIQWELQQKAIGGLMSETSGHIVHQFLENGRLEVVEPIEIEYLLLGGGGAGGDGYSAGSPQAGGGGGGGVLTNFEDSKRLLMPGTYEVIIGQGGLAPAPGVDGTGTNGGNTMFDGLVAYGGGFGGGENNSSVDLPAGSGGCGGGAGLANVSGVGVAGQGYDGGGRDPSNGSGASGGGGAGGPGQINQPSNAGGDGGIGLRSLITGAEVYYGGGGGGGAYGNGQGEGGLGGGGDSGQRGQYGYGGGGGGGGGGNRDGRIGGSGRVIIRYNATGIADTGASIPEPFYSAYFDESSGSTITLQEELPNIFNSSGDYIEFEYFPISGDAKTVLGSTITSSSIVVSSGQISIINDSATGIITLDSPLAINTWNTINLSGNGSNIFAIINDTLQTGDFSSIIAVDTNIISKNTPKYNDIKSIKLYGSQNSYLYKIAPSIEIYGDPTGFWRAGSFYLDTSGNHTIFDNLSGNNGWRLEVLNDFFDVHKMQFTVGNGSSTVSLLDNDTEITPGSWVHFYIDLEQVTGLAPGDVGITGFSPETGTLFIGSRLGTSNFLDGKVDSLIGGTGILTDNQKNWIFNSGEGRVINDFTSSSVTPSGLLSFGFGLSELTGIRRDSFGNNHLLEFPGYIVNENINNGNFELTGTTTSGFPPYGWTYSRNGDGGTGYIESGSMVYDGNYSVKIIRGNNGLIRLKTGITLVPGVRYNFSVWAAVSDLSSSPAFNIREDDPDQILGIPFTSTGWANYVATFVAKGGELSLQSASNTNNLTLYFDNFTASPAYIKNSNGLRTSFTNESKFSGYLRNLRFMSNTVNSVYNLYSGALDNGEDANHGTAYNVDFKNINPTGLY